MPSEHLPLTLTKELFSTVRRSTPSYEITSLTPLSRLFKHFQSVSISYSTCFPTPITIFSLTRMRQMACHPDLVLRSKTNAAKFVEDVGEATVCRICNDVAEDAIESKCHHIFDRECIRQYLETAMVHTVCLDFLHIYDLLNTTPPIPA